MRKGVLIALALIATAPATQAGPLRDWLRARREARQQPQACQPCQSPPTFVPALPLLAHPLMPAVAEPAPVQSLRGLFGAPRQTGGCANGTCPK